MPRKGARCIWGGGGILFQFINHLQYDAPSGPLPKTVFLLQKVNIKL